MEIWKSVIGYDNAYQISNLGRVRSLDRIDVDCHGKKQKRKGKLIKQSENSKGYLRVHLGYRGKKEVRFVHRMVAEAFVTNSDPDINDTVNHLDCNPKNNKYDNLEWTTRKGNSQYAVLKGRMNRTEVWLEHLHKAQEKYYKAVAAYDRKTGELISIFKSVNECKKFGYQPSCVCDCCKGKRATHKGLIWKYIGTDTKDPAELERLVKEWGVRE